MDILFDLLISPLKLIYQFLFEGVYSVIHNYGISLLALSLVTSFLFVPLEKLVSKAIAREKLIQSILKPQILKIKEAYKGAEQSRALSRLYYRYAYNPILSGRSALGVLIQLPLLIGAYWMISEYEALKGIAFLGIKDLSQPDALFFGFNALPILMTVINLMTVAVSIGMQPKERIQAIVIAAVFLVLLYSAPSALLVYWTANNALMFLKACIRRFTSTTHIFSSILALTKNISKKYSQGIYYLIGVSLATLMLSRHAPGSDSLGAVLWFISDTLLIIVVWGLIKKSMLCLCTTKDYHQVTILQWLLLLAFGYCALRLIGVWCLDIARGKISYFLIGIPFIVFIVENFDKYKKYLNQIESSGIEKMFWPASTLLLVMVFIYFPINLYLSDVTLIEGVPSKILTTQLVLFEAAIFALFLIWKLFVKQKFVTLTLSLFVTFCAICALIFGFAVTPDYGILDGFNLQKTEALFDKNKRLIDIGVGLFVLLTLAILIFKRYEVIVKQICTFASCGLLLLTTWGWCTHNWTANSGNETVVGIDQVPANVQEMLTFSKDGKNVVIVMLDMFTGGHMKEILERVPEFRDEFDGFTWYADTLSAGPVTILGKAGILGGEAATPLKINALNNSSSIEEKITKNWSEFLSFFDKNKIPFAIADYMWVKPELMSKHLNNHGNYLTTYPVWDGAVDLWAKNENYHRESLDSSPEKFLTTMGIFQTIPLSSRKHVYQSGNWLGMVDKGNWGLNHALEWYSELDSYYRYSKVDNRKGSFKFIVNLSTHHPWTLDSKCRPINGENRLESKWKNSSGIYEEHLQAEVCALKSLSKWISWMKTQGIYDNTLLIIVSDHGKEDSSQLTEIWPNRNHPLGVYGLLLIKEFNSRGQIKTDTTSLMANWDIPSIIKFQLGDSTIEKKWLNPQRERCVVDGDWRRERMNKDSYIFSAIWCIKGSMFHYSNWRQIK